MVNNILTAVFQPKHGMQTNICEPAAQGKFRVRTILQLRAAARPPVAARSFQHDCSAAADRLDCDAMRLRRLELGAI